MAKCKGCGREIIWIATPAGKSMPCDPRLVYFREDKTVRDRIALKTGAVVCGTICGQEEATGAGYVPHWSTCLKSGFFRRGVEKPKKETEAQGVQIRLEEVE